MIGCQDLGDGHAARVIRPMGCLRPHPRNTTMIASWKVLPASAKARCVPRPCIHSSRPSCLQALEDRPMTARPLETAPTETDPSPASHADPGKHQRVLLLSVCELRPAESQEVPGGGGQPGPEPTRGRGHQLHGLLGRRGRGSHGGRPLKFDRSSATLMLAIVRTSVNVTWGMEDENSRHGTRSCAVARDSNESNTDSNLMQR